MFFISDKGFDILVANNLPPAAVTVLSIVFSNVDDLSPVVDSTNSKESLVAASISTICDEQIFFKGNICGNFPLECLRI